jgi:hypothetical protein
MIDLNRIRNLKELEEMKGDLLEFINNPEIANVYVEDYGWGPEDFEADTEEVKRLLEKIERRMKSLDRYLTKSGSAKL